jgi:hypothetical protein
MKGGIASPGNKSLSAKIQETSGGYNKAVSTGSYIISK